LYSSTSGSACGGGGTGARLGGGGGWRVVPLLVDVEVMLDLTGADTLNLPGNGFTAGLGLEAPVGF